MNEISPINQLKVVEAFKASKWTWENIGLVNENLTDAFPSNLKPFKSLQEALKAIGDGEDLEKRGFSLVEGGKSSQLQKELEEHSKTNDKNFKPKTYKLGKGRQFFQEITIGSKRNLLLTTRSEENELGIIQIDNFNYTQIGRKRHMDYGGSSVPEQCAQLPPQNVLDGSGPRLHK